MHLELSRRRLSSITRTWQLCDPIAYFASARDESVRSLWLRPQSGEALVGLGAAAIFVGDGQHRFSDIADAWQELVGRACIDGGEPIALGGFSFDPRREATALWDGFPTAQMVLPERVLSIGHGAAQLTTNAIDRQAAPIRHLHHRAASGLSGDAWQELVGDVASSIGLGELGLRKVVLATTREVHHPASVADALRALARAYPTCTIFAFARGNACFLGATPERLISLREGNAMTMALAGSAPRGATPEDDICLEQRLLNDPKEQTEHGIVVSTLRDSLMAVCDRVVIDAAPRVRKLENVQHLMTTVRAQLARGRSVLDLVERLHPTPALGGFPREAALNVIRQREELDRGWYAAPIGWMDASGDGEFVAGIRSGLVRGDSATLFAGCGIVAGSDPAAEYTELGWKLQPMLSALGLTG